MRRRMVSDALRLVAARRMADLGASALAQALGLSSGPAVRDRLAQGIDALKPAASSEPDLTDRRWRPTFILERVYFTGRPRDEVAERLFIDRGTYNHEQARAIDLLAEQLFDLPQPNGASPNTAPAVRFHRPPSTPRLIGREVILDKIIALLLAHQSVALHGLPGAGKSTLLAALANDARIKAHFADGVLWSALGITGDARATLAEWGLALGLPRTHLGEMRDVIDLARTVHDAIGDKRVLLIADDVWESSTALALRVGGVNTARLIATRSPVVAHDFAGEHTLALHELNSDDSLSLLQAFAPDVVAKHSDEALALCAAVGGLPLSLTLIGSRLRQVSHANQGRRIERELAHLRESAARSALALSEAPHERRNGLPANSATTLDSVIALSEGQLSPEARHALYTLSVFPPKPNSFDEAAGLAVSDVLPEDLDELVDAGLIETVAGSRYRLHQVIADYGRARLNDTDAPSRFVEHFVSLAECDAVDPRDIDNCLAALDVAEHIGQREWQVCGVLALVPLLETRGDYARAQTLIEQVERAAVTNEQSAKLLAALGFVQMKRGDYAHARESLERGLALARESMQPRLVAEALQQLGTVASDMADYDAARAHYAEALDIARRIDDLKRMTEVLFYLAVMHDQQSRFDEAERCGREGLEIAQRIGHREFIAAHMGGLGVLMCKRGRLDEGVRQLHAALALAQEIGFQEGVALFNFVLGYGYASLEQNATGLRHYAQGLSVARAIGHSRSTAMLQAALGELTAREGDMAAGLSMCDDAIALARRVGHSHELSFALEQRASVKTQLRDLDGAVADCTEAIAAAQRIGSAEREAFALARLAAAYAAQRKLALAAKTGAQCLALLRRVGYRVTEIAEYLVRSRVRQRM